MERMRLEVGMGIGMLIGLLACLPEARKAPLGWLLSMACGVVGSCLGWALGIFIEADQVGPWAQLFLVTVGAGVVVSVYQAATSPRPPLR